MSSVSRSPVATLDDHRSVSVAHGEIFALVRDFRQLTPENRHLAQLLVARMLMAQERSSETS